jgi:parvulin-like peptidyl-prolyl isomerase
MRKWLPILRPGRWALRKLPLGLALLAVAAASFCWGRWGMAPRAEGQVPQPTINSVAATPGAKLGDYANRVVAYLYNDAVAVTREELGEYLIARFGAERLDFLVNRKIVEMECAAKGIVVDDAEVKAEFDANLLAFKLTQDQFVKSVLGQYRKTLYEWKEDVIRPKLMIAKLVRSTLTVTEDETRKAFDAKYGPKVQCRMIVLQKDNSKKFEVWERARQSPAAFKAEAKNQDLTALGATEGEVPPIHRHFGDTRIEQAAFSLKEGEVSRLFDLPDGSHVILLCEKHLPADAQARYETERMKLMKDVAELKLTERIPEVVKELRARANPRLLLTQNQQQAAAQIQPAAPMSVPPLPGAGAPTAQQPRH